MSLLRDSYPEDYDALVEKTGLEFADLIEWERAAEHMYLAVDEKTGIHPQDDSFLDKALWDLADTPPDHYPLLLHYHPLTIYRHQVIKQADVVMAMFLLGDEFTLEEKKRNFDYYDPLPTGDSSLSSLFTLTASVVPGNYPINLAALGVGFFGISGSQSLGSYTVVPEPTTAALMGLGLLGLAVAGRRR